VGFLGAAALATAVLLGAAAPAWADGAVAVGSTGDVVKDGIAFGMVVNEPKATAADTAVARCRTFKARAAAERCKVVATFSGECFAVAYDPQPGTPGAGWGVGPDQASANRKAITMCEQSAGAGRKGQCQVKSAACDTGTAAATTPDLPDAVTPPGEKVTATPDGDDEEWTEVRKTLSRQQQGQFNWDVAVLVLLAGAVAWVAYAMSRSLKGKANRQNLSGPSKAKAAAGKPAKGKAQRGAR
jgi:hypothetical protein